MTLSGLIFALMIAAFAMSVFAQADERPAMSLWARAALLGEQAAPVPAAPGLHVRRQDHGQLSLRKSVMNTPLQVGQKRYEHGLGTHAFSEIVVRLQKPGKRFEAEAGVDNNYDTAGKRGSVVFAVEIAGKEVFRSDVRRGGNEPLPVRVDLNGAKEFVLRVGDAGDGVAYDQADWAEAAVTLDDGERLWLDEMPVIQPVVGLSSEIPFSFIYGGKPSAEFLQSWKRTQTQKSVERGRERHVVTYTDPASGLVVSSEITLFSDFPAVEWLLRLRNTGAADTPILENLLPLDLKIAAPKGDITLHRSHGSTCQPTDFLPIDERVAPSKEVTLSPRGGRSSNGVLPFFNLEWAGGGIVGAIGWSGQWQMRLRRDGGGGLSLQAGQQTTHLKLRPGEGIRTPRILLTMWKGDDRLRGHNLLRRLLLAHYVPRIQGEIVVPPITENTWFAFNTGNAVTEQNQLHAIRCMAPLGVECYWLDAGWFEGGWPTGVGSWVPKKEAFPRGLKPLGDAAHERGMKFVVWFEPERVNPNSRIAKEHPEWVLRVSKGDGLFNLGDPAAREWLTNYLSKFFADSGIDIYRNDFNIDPLPFWQASDAPDRQGIAEIRYIEGLYAMWDALIERQPGLWIDNCASGGRRIDLETISRSLPLWRSDTQCCGRPMPVQDQVQTAGLSLYVPLHSAGVWSFDPYSFRSVATTGTNLCMDTRAKDFPADKAKSAIAEAKMLRPLYLGDYYPLLDVNLDEHHWCGWQFDRPELGKGFAVLFRRSGSPYPILEVGLRGLDPKGTYEVVFVDMNKKQAMTGAELAHLRLELPTAPASLLITYTRSGARRGRKTND
jgi:alpha-galactosidase